MKKRIVQHLIFGIIGIIIFSNLSFANSDNLIDVEIPQVDIKINNQLIDNENSKFPCLMYRGVIYIPMNSNYTEALGLETKWNYKGELSILKGKTNNLKLMQELGDKNDTKYKATLPKFKIHLNDNELNNDKEEYPFLFFRDTVYFPTTWKVVVEELGLEMDWNNQGFSLKSKNYNSKKEEKNTDRVSLGYDNTKVATRVMVNGNRLSTYRADGNKVYMDLTSGREMVMDLAVARGRNRKTGVVYDGDMAESYLITDMTNVHDGNGQNLKIYTIGVAFDSNGGGYNYSQQEQNLGDVYTFVFEVNPLTKTAKVVFGGKGMSLLGYPYDTEFNESKVNLDDNSLYKSKGVFNFAERVIAPRIIKSKYKKDTVYILLDDENTGSAVWDSDKFHILEFNLKSKSVVRSLFVNKDIYKNKSLEQGYKHYFDKTLVFVMEEGKDILNIASLGNEKSKLSISIQVDMTTGERTSQEYYWKPREEVMKLVTSY